MWKESWRADESGFLNNFPMSLLCYMVSNGYDFPYYGIRLDFGVSLVMEDSNFLTW